METLRVALGDIAEVTKLAGFEFTKHIEYLPDGEIIAIRGLNVKKGILDLTNIKRISIKASDQLPRSKLFKNDLVLTYTGTIGEVALVTEDDRFHLAPNVAVVRPSGVNPYYLYCYMRSRVFQRDFETFSVGSTQKTVPMKNIRQVEIPLLPDKTQIEIGRIISLFDDKIELNQKMNQTLEEIAKAIFKSWFVDFDPVQAKAEGRPTGLPPEISDLFPDELVDSEIGEIPKGWEIAELSKYVDVLNGFAFKSKDYESDGVFVLRTKNFDQGLVKKLTDDVFLPSSFMTSNSKHICEPYDYHLVMVGASIGSRGMLFPHQLPALRNQNMWCFRSKNKSNFSQLLVKLYLDNFIDSKMGLASGSAREFFKKGDFQSHRLCFATQSVRGYFSNCYSVMLEKIQNNLAQIETLSELRDTLLPKLISGELRIPDAEKFLEEAGI